MKPQWDNQVMSSTVLWMDHVLHQLGSGFQNASGYFSDIPDMVNGLYAYAAPYKPILADASVTGATIMTGIYLDNAFLASGQSGFVAINYPEATVYFTGEITGTNRISGDFSIGEFQVVLTSKSEEELLFETKYLLKSRMDQTLSGLAENQSTFPIVFLKNNGGRNMPFQFGGTDQTVTNVRAIIMADSQFNLDACASLMKDQIRTHVPILTQAEMPYNALGCTGPNGYNYLTVIAGKIPASACFVDDVTFLSFDRSSRIFENFKEVNPGCHPGMLDIRLIGYRAPRQSL